MKLSFAAVLLGQTIPALSKQHGDGPLWTRNNRALRRATSEIPKATSSSQSLILGQDGERRGPLKRRRGMRQVARNLKNAPSVLTAAVPCDPRSTDADVGILSCGNDSICKPSITSSLGGVCTPVEGNHLNQGIARGAIFSSKGPLVNRGTTNMVECDPVSIDTGILSCGEGQICKHDESSGLGGFCFDTTASDDRRLQNYPLQYFLYSCGPFPDDSYVGFSCDCSGLDLAMGAGDIQCSQNNTAQYVQGCDEHVVYNFWSYSFKDWELVKARECYETTSPYNETICFTYHSFDEKGIPCYAEWNGQRCTSCDVTNNFVPSFNCSNVDGPVGDSTNELLSVFEVCSNSTCTDLCGEGYTFGGYDPGSFESYYCGLLSYYSENAVLPDESCPYFIESAQLYGCCVPLNSTSSGGNNATIPEEDDDEETNDSSFERAPPTRLLRASRP